MDSDPSLFDPEINILELGQKIRKLNRYIGRAEVRLKKRTAELEKLTTMSSETERLVALGLELIDPERVRGNDA